MLPQQFKLQSSADFSFVVRKGRRVGRRTVVLHILDRSAYQGAKADVPFVRHGGPHVGLIVSKAVGNSVVRHAIARKLRHIAAAVAPEISADLDIVIRALPRSADATSEELEKDVRSALKIAPRR
ncbi:ribonuclease P protein component [Corynebacterium sp. H113]|uniref:ribonuclease P protein component n=1 Tax=Corynebacterium sp. H113 TaxID=3133419 RepID=UPI00309C16D8